ncbi:hypothetical protein YC2023_098976 [Brassica napus]
MGECAKIGRGCMAMYGSVRTEHVKEALCNLRVLGEGPGRLESRRHQEDALWRQTTNGSFLVCDWLVLVLDRLSLAVKRREPRP